MIGINKISIDLFKDNVTRKALGSFCVKSLSFLLSFILGILLARSLGVDGYGVYSYAMTIVGFLLIPICLGMPNFLVRQISIYVSSGDHGLVRGLARFSHYGVIATSLLVAAISMLFGHLFARSLSQSALLTFAYSLILLPILSVNAIREACLRSFHRVVLGQLPDQVIRLMLLVLMILAAKLVLGESLTPEMVMALHGGAAVIALAVGAAFLKNVMNKELSEGVKPEYRIIPWLKGAWPFALLAGLEVVNGMSDILILGLLKPASEVGIYKVVSTAAQLVSFVLFSVNVTLAPIVAKLYFERRLDDLQEIITRSVRIVFAISLPATLVLALGGNWFLTTLYGTEFARGDWSLILLCLGQLVNAAMGSVGLVLNMTNNQNDCVRGLSIAGAINIVLNFCLIPQWGIEGAALSTMVSMIVWNLLLAHWAFKKTGIRTSIFGSFGHAK